MVISGRIREMWQQFFQAEPALGLPAALGVAAAVGLLSGAGEVAVKAIKYRFDHVFFEWSNPDALWMIPTAQAGVFVVIALVMFLAASRPARRLSLRSLLLVFGTLGTWSMIASFTRSGIHMSAEAVLSIGAGIQLARTLGRRKSLVNWVAPAGAAIAVAALVTFIGLRPIDRARERAHLANIGAPADSSPNVLLIVLDVVRAMNLELYGYPRPTTPHLVRLAERGVTFDRAYAPSPWTLPSHASMFTGRWYTELSSEWLEPLDAQYPTLAGFLADQGYVTGGFVANLLYTTRSTGLARGFASYRDHELDVPTWLSSSEVVAKLTKWVRALIPGGSLLFARKFATEVNREFLDWLDDDVGERPFFAFLNYFDAHVPYEGFGPWYETFATDDSRDSVMVGPGQARILSEDEKDVIDRYDSAIAFMDEAVGTLLDSLEARGELDNTLVIVVGDHGEQLQEHGLEGHANSLYTPLIHVPLVALWPGRIPAGRRIAQPVSIRDIPSTVVDLLGRTGADSFAGHSLASTWSADDVIPEPILAEANPYPLFEYDGPVARGPMKSVVLGPLHYIRNGDGVEELYDTDADPDEIDNLVGTVRGDRLLPEMRKALLDLHAGGNFRADTWSFLPDFK